MGSSFLALMNKKGIACASDTDMSLYSLYGKNPDKEIVCIAVNPYSEFPCDEVINDFLRKGGFHSQHDTLKDYADEFFKLVDKDDYQFAKEKCLFLGFCENDVFPSVVEINADKKSMLKITHRKSTGMAMLGDFKGMDAFLYGMTSASRCAYEETIKKQKAAVKERVRNTEQEEFITGELNNWDVQNIFDRAKIDHEALFNEALDSFNVEDLVHTSEMFLNFNAQFQRLHYQGELRYTKELAVITRTEGLKWIKHCLYG